MASTENQQDVWHKRIVATFERLVDLVLKAPLISFIIYLCVRDWKRDIREDEVQDRNYQSRYEYLMATKELITYIRDERAKDLDKSKRELEAKYVDTVKND